MALMVSMVPMESDDQSVSELSMLFLSVLYLYPVGLWSPVLNLFTYAINARLSVNSRDQLQSLSFLPGK